MAPNRQSRRPSRWRSAECPLLRRRLRRDGSLDEVVVSGTRIQQTSGMDTPTPVAALSATEITSMAPGSLAEALTQLPQFYAQRDRGDLQRREQRILQFPRRREPQPARHRLRSAR